MKLLKQSDPFLQRYSALSHSTFLSHSSHYEIIACCSEEATEKYVYEMNVSKIYSLMADTAKDRHAEHAALCTCNITPEGMFKESFLGFCKLEEFDGDSITDAIEHMLQSKNLGNRMCVAQAYEGALVTSELNWVLFHTCMAVPEATNFFDLLESVHSFVNASLVNHKECPDL